ncbi:hypothetical protein LCGC14_2254780, partial [marine sediment metagenome]
PMNYGATATGAIRGIIASSSRTGAYVNGRVEIGSHG